MELIKSKKASENYLSKIVNITTFRKHNDPEQSGMFDDNGRVKVIKLRGELSEGFILPIVVLQNYVVSVTNYEIDEIKESIEFDAVSHDGKEFQISKKYVTKRQFSQGGGKGRIFKKVPKGLDKVIDTQFRFHYDRCVA